jgi:hypothetical protein
MMNRQISPTPLRLQRFAWMVALVVLLRVAAWDLHHVLDFHADTGERCQACLVMERGGDGVAPSAGAALDHPCGQAPLPMLVGLVPTAPAPGPWPRGPPSSFS